METEQVLAHEDAYKAGMRKGAEEARQQLEATIGQVIQANEQMKLERQKAAQSAAEAWKGAKTLAELKDKEAMKLQEALAGQTEKLEKMEQQLLASHRVCAALRQERDALRGQTGGKVGGETETQYHAPEGIELQVVSLEDEMTLRLMAEEREKKLSIELTELKISTASEIENLQKELQQSKMSKSASRGEPVSGDDEPVDMDHARQFVKNDGQDPRATSPRPTARGKTPSSSRSKTPGTPRSKTPSGPRSKTPSGPRRGGGRPERSKFSLRAACAAPSRRSQAPAQSVENDESAAGDSNGY